MIETGGKTNPWLLFELWAGFNKAAFRDISLIKLSCKIWGWGNGWRTHNSSELWLNMWKCIPGTGRELSFHEWGVDINLAITQELVGKDREINVILNRQAALMENMLHWSFPPTLSFPWHHPAASSGSISGSPSLQRVIRLEKQGPEGPRTQFLLTRHWPQQCPPQIPPTQIRLYCCNNIASSSSGSWRVIRQKTHSHKQL